MDASTLCAASVKQTWRDRLRAGLDLMPRRIRPGLRSLLGLLLILGGIFGFLPILGFWMLPLGLALIGMDLRDLWRWLRQRWSRKR